MMEVMRTYSELSKINSYEERFEYLKLNGFVGVETFGFDRYINQRFYKSLEWKRIRDKVIIRDNGCDLGVEGYEIHGRILIHHMNPVTPDELRSNLDLLLNPEYLICVAHNTHNAIHYGDSDLLITAPVERTAFDTCPWRSV